MPTRLDSVDTALADRVARATPERQREAAVAAAMLAVSVTGLSGDVVDAAASALRERRIAGSLLRRLDDLVDQLDEAGFKLQARVDDGRAEYADYVAAFSRARAASALRFAMLDDVDGAALEGIYEAYAAVGDLERIHAAVDPALDG